MFYPMKFAEPLAGVTNTICMNFHLILRIRTRELSILSFWGESHSVPVHRIIRYFAVSREWTLHNLCFLLHLGISCSHIHYGFWMSALAYMSVELHKCHHFLLRPHKVPHGEGHIHLHHCQEKCKDMTSPSNMLFTCSPKKVTDSANYYDYPQLDNIWNVDKKAPCTWRKYSSPAHPESTLTNTPFCAPLSTVPLSQRSCNCCMVPSW